MKQKKKVYYRKKTKTESVSMYKDISEIPLYNFLKALCEDDLSYLYKEPPKMRNAEKEVEIFEELVLQYTEASEDNAIPYENIKKIAVLMAKIRICEAAFGLVDKIPDKVSGVLKSIGLRLTKDMQKNVLIIQGKLSGFMREYSNLIDKADKNDKSDKKPTINQYIDILTAISTHFKIHLDVHTVTLASFCSYYKSLTRDLVSMKRVNRKGK